jgi:hypothetical protein
MEGQVEVAAVVAPAPGGWLAEHQRANCDGTTSLTSYQGLLFDEIVLPQSDVEHADPARLVGACSEWADAILHQAFLIPGEFAPEALWSYYANDYLVQARAGGHAHYFAARGADELAIKCCSAGLKSMLADPHLELYDLMVRLNRSPAKAAQKLAVAKGYRNTQAALRDLDKRLADLEQQEPLTPRHKTWLKSLRKVKFGSDAEVTQLLNQAAVNNPLRLARQGEMARVRSEAQNADPGHRAALQLCEMAGLRMTSLRRGGFIEMRKLWPEGPEGAALAFRVETDQGSRAALFYTQGGLFKRRLAVLIEQGNPLPAGSLTLSKQEYETIAPATRA